MKDIQVSSVCSRQKSRVGQGRAFPDTKITHTGCYSQSWQLYKLFLLVDPIAGWVTMAKTQYMFVD